MMVTICMQFHQNLGGAICRALDDLTWNNSIIGEGSYTELYFLFINVDLFNY